MQISTSFSSLANNAYKGISRQNSTQNSAAEYESIAKSSNAFTQNAYTITVPRVEKVLQEGKAELIYPTPSQTPFSSALSQKQAAVSASEYDLAVKRVVELMSELSSFVTARQGEDSELSYYISTMSEFFAGQTKFNQENLNTIKNQIKKCKKR